MLRHQPTAIAHPGQQTLVRLRVPLNSVAQQIDDGNVALRPDWEPAKEAPLLAFVEDRTIFEGYSAASIEGIRSASSNPALTLPEDPRETPDVISQALVRNCGWPVDDRIRVGSPTSTPLRRETSDHGYPIRGAIRN